MAIDVFKEETIPLCEVPALPEIPSRRGGSKLNLATLYRWWNKGCRGIKLETVLIGGVRCTSRQALQRFFDRLTEQDAPNPAPAPSTARAHAASRREARAILDRAGI